MSQEETKMISIEELNNIKDLSKLNTVEGDLKALIELNYLLERESGDKFTSDELKKSITAFYKGLGLKIDSL